MIVLDCSYAMALVMHDETRPASLMQALSGRLYAPAIWPLEVANALRNSVRRRRLSETEVPAVCADLEALGVETLNTADGRVRPHFEAAQTHGLTPYDTAYLELALQRHWALATLDSQMSAAAQRAGVVVLS